MKGLVMLKEYADEILSGRKTYDARAYDTGRRGIIAIVDTNRSVVMGFVELTGTHLISAKEYADWHKVGKWENSDFSADANGTYYAYDFANPVILDEPVRIEKNGRTWCDVDDGIYERRNRQISLF